MGRKRAAAMRERHRIARAKIDSIGPILPTLPVRLVSMDERRLEVARKILAKAGDAGTETRETTPRLGGLRRRTADILVRRGEAEWIVPGKIIRALQR